MVAPLLPGMRVLVTGGAGFIGSFVVDRLLALGHEVRVFDGLDPQVHPRGVPVYLSSGAELLTGDVRNRGQCAKALEGVEVVVHAAAAVGVAQSLYRVEHYVDVNVRGTATLLQCIAERQHPLRKVVVLTSMTGYGEGVYRRPSDGRHMRVGIRSEGEIQRYGWDPVCPETKEPLEPVPTPEGAELMARNVYALSKRYQEELALSLGSVYRFPVVCLRMFNVYGPRQSLSNPYTGVLAIFLSRLMTGQPPIVYEDGLQTRDFVSVHDVVDAIVAAIASPAADGEVINIGSGVPQSIGEVARVLANVAGVSSIKPTITGQFRRGDVRHCIADLSRARRLLGFTPKVTWEAGLMELARWCKAADAADRFDQADHELRARGLLSERLDAQGGAKYHEAGTHHGEQRPHRV
ncbi:MAG: NAD-dependent epimerase/dehydratase family protein [candidate division NC10 bacterium]|nr:NAD-dependent epimerase/dehydratase family protein [candidate division NC10 bacterium]MDE2321401.1 NAD-dependent epimerase/dehydratase family protein [candidate division NC10 bacterium]